MVRKWNNQTFAVDGQSGNYRTHTYSAWGYRRLLRRAGFNGIHVACVNPSYDIPQHAFPWSAATSAMQRFSSLFLGRNYRPWADRFCCSNFFLYASKAAAPPAVSAEPVLFGYFDGSRIAGDYVRRTDLQGRVRTELIVPGKNALKSLGRQHLTTSQVAEAYRRFLDTPNGKHPEPQTGPELEVLLAPLVAGCLAPPTLPRLVKLLNTMPHEPLYHGDFWVGNLVIPANPAEAPVLLDAESHLFGSRLLDVADFCTDFMLHGRSRDFPGISVEALCRMLGVEFPGKDLVMTALLRQILRYSPHHRSHALIYDYRRWLAACEKAVNPWDVLNPRAAEERMT